MKFLLIYFVLMGNVFILFFLLTQTKFSRPH